jgi:hypothetical protein
MSPSLMAPVGHSPAQVPHAAHASVILNAIENSFNIGSQMIVQSLSIVKAQLVETCALVYHPKS